MIENLGEPADLVVVEIEAGRLRRRLLVALPDPLYDRMFQLAHIVFTAGDNSAPFGRLADHPCRQGRQLPKEIGLLVGPEPQLTTEAFEFCIENRVRLRLKSGHL